MSDLSAHAARALTDQIRAQADVLVPLVIQAFRGNAWRVLGYDSWDAYRAAEFPGVRVEVTARPGYARQLRDAGMSQRQIGGVLGTSHQTVGREIGAAQSDGPTGPSNAQTLMSGGRAYERAATTEPGRQAAEVARALDRYAPDPEAGKRQWRAGLA